METLRQHARYSAGDPATSNAAIRVLGRAIALGLVASLAVSSPAIAQLGVARNGLAALFAPVVAPDPPDVPGSPLDVRRVAFGQQGAELSLQLSTDRPWATRELLSSGRSLCVVVSSAGRLCVGPFVHTTVLRLTRDGEPGPGRRIDANVSRPDDRSVSATFSAAEIGLARGPFTWSVDARWQGDGTCAIGCEDLVPDRGDFSATVAVLAQPPCFGAAARDRLHVCRNPALRHAAVPSPFVAQIAPNSPCRLVSVPRPGSVLHPCEFGVTGDERTATVALIGDSHAEMWRAAIDVVAQAKGWRGVSIARPGCPFSAHVPASPDLGPAQCARLHDETLAWLAARPAVHTIFVADWAQPDSGPAGGIDGYGGGAAAFGAMLDRVPRSVRRIYVLRDIPGTALDTATCVTVARDRHRPLAGACALPRSAALTPDPGAQAAAQRPSRARVIDLTRFFCRSTRCDPVIGGGYVYRDDNHMNAVFSSSLGPFVLRAINSFEHA